MPLTAANLPLVTRWGPVAGARGPVYGPGSSTGLSPVGHTSDSSIRCRAPRTVALSIVVATAAMSVVICGHISATVEGKHDAAGPASGGTGTIVAIHGS